MRVIPPLTITDSILISSTVSEPDAGSPTTEAVYNSGTTYALGDVVISTTQHRKYESLAAGNVGNPLPVLPATATLKWLDIGPTNKWSMFDLYRNTQTEGPSPLVVKLAPNARINAVALLGLAATLVTLSLDSAVGSPSVNYYTYSENLRDREVSDWYDYFFEPFNDRNNVSRFDLPPYAGAVLTITINNPGGVSKCGAVVLGAFQYIGETQHEAESDALNFSTIDRDVFGNATLVPRRSIPKANITLICDKSLVNAVRNLRTELNAVPALWSGLDDSSDGNFEAVLILGIYRVFRIMLSDPTSIINLELEEI